MQLRHRFGPSKPKTLLVYRHVTFAYQKQGQFVLVADPTVAALILRPLILNQRNRVKGISIFMSTTPGGNSERSSLRSQCMCLNRFFLPTLHYRLPPLWIIK